MVFSLTWMPTVLETAGLKVSEVPDWRTRGRGPMANLVRGVIVHHTAGAPEGNMPSLGTLLRGRPDLRGPLANLGLGRDGTFYIIAAGRANHAGEGKWRGIATGNSSFIGIEAENTGKPEDVWPEVQLDALRRGCAALLKHLGSNADMVCGHKEFALPPGRKPDPRWEMAPFREAVAALIAGQAPAPQLIPAIDAAARPTLRRGARGDIVRIVQRAIGEAADGVFGPATEARVRRFQRSQVLVPDGIVGPRTWAAIDAPAPAAATSAAASAAAATLPAAVVSTVADVSGLPPADTSDRPVSMAGSNAIAPDGEVFARRFKLGFMTVGETGARAWIASEPTLAQTISPSALRVVAAVTGNEGKLEAINSYDNAFLSVGILQWTAGAGTGAGELGGLLDLIERSDADAFRECFGRFGIGSDMAGGHITGFVTLDGVRLKSAATKDQLRSATWAYRFWRAAHHPSVRRCQVALAVERIARFSDILVSGHRIRDWLSSELGMAMILDQHVNRPGHVPATIRDAVAARLSAGASADPAQWDAEEEHRLIESYLALRAKTSMTDQLKRAGRLFDEARRGLLSDDRGSFQ